MLGVSIIMPVLNGEDTVVKSLESIDRSIAHFQATGGADGVVEVVVVDDGSEDYTLGCVLAHARGRAHYNVLHRAEGSSPAHARNCGVAAARGAAILYLDADDLFAEDHIRICHDALADPTVQVVKTGIRLTDPVHPDWAARIAHSLVINLGVRRECHEQIGGFFDYHLIRRFPDGYDDRDGNIFYMIEDVFYNDILKAMFRLEYVDRETAVYCRRPGNSFDRQYTKFCAPADAPTDPYDPETRLRIQIAQLITNYHKTNLTNSGAIPQN